MTLTKQKLFIILFSTILGLFLITGGITAGILLTKNTNPPADAATFTDANGIEYTTSGTTAEVSDYTGSATTLEIPASVSNGTTTPVPQTIDK